MSRTGHRLGFKSHKTISKALITVQHGPSRQTQISTFIFHYFIRVLCTAMISLSRFLFNEHKQEAYRSEVEKFKILIFSKIETIFFADNIISKLSHSFEEN